MLISAASTVFVIYPVCVSAECPLGLQSQSG